MEASQEEERYKQFESLRERFKVSVASPKTAPPPKDRPRSGNTKKRAASYDPRGNAPPLMPLVEEGDQIQQGLYTNQVDERLQKLSVSEVSAVYSQHAWKLSTKIVQCS